MEIWRCKKRIALSGKKPPLEPNDFDNIFIQVTALLTPDKELPPTPIDALAKLDSLVYNGTTTGTTGSKPESKPETVKPEIKPDISSSKPDSIKPDTVSGSKPEVRTESSKPETEAKKETEVPEPNGIEPFKETYFDEHNHVHYFRYIMNNNSITNQTSYYLYQFIFKYKMVKFVLF